jgi:IS4 transposase
MAFAQLTWREGLRDIATCLNARPKALYHLGFSGPVARSTLADANEKRDWRLWEDLARTLIRKARRLYAGENLGLDLENTLYALDSTTVDLSLTLFPWADFRRTKAGVKLHTQIDLRGPIPTCIHITEARMHDVRWLDALLFEPGAFYVMDRGYMDFRRLNTIAQAGAFFVTRAKDNLRFSRQRSRPVDYASGVRSDQVGKPTHAKARRDFPSLLRKVRYFDAETQRDLVFLTNHPDVPAVTVAQLYRMRWQIELFFRWIKGHLRIKHYYGTTPNAVKTQIWIAVIVYLAVAILHKQMNLPGKLHRTLQLLSVHPFEKAPLHELLTEPDFNTLTPLNSNQLPLFDL